MDAPAEIREAFFVNHPQRCGVRSVERVHYHETSAIRTRSTVPTTTPAISATSRRRSVRVIDMSCSFQSWVPLVHSDARFIFPAEPVVTSDSPRRFPCRRVGGPALFSHATPNHHSLHTFSRERRKGRRRRHEDCAKPVGNTAASRLCAGVRREALGNGHRGSLAQS